MKCDLQNVAKLLMVDISTLTHYVFIYSACSTPPIISLGVWYIVTVEYSSSDGLALLEIDGVQYTNHETWVSFLSCTILL